jgi:hypothetical protein
MRRRIFEILILKIVLILSFRSGLFNFVQDKKSSRNFPLCAFACCSVISVSSVNSCVNSRDARTTLHSRAARLDRDKRTNAEQNRSGGGAKRIRAESRPNQKRIKGGSIPNRPRINVAQVPPNEPRCAKNSRNWPDQRNLAEMRTALKNQNPRAGARGFFVSGFKNSR